MSGPHGRSSQRKNTRNVHTTVIPAPESIRASACQEPDPPPPCMPSHASHHWPPHEQDPGALQRFVCGLMTGLSGPITGILAGSRRQQHAGTHPCDRSGVVSLITLAPPCKEYSRLKLRPGGSRALRTPTCMQGVPDLSPKKNHA